MTNNTIRAIDAAPPAATRAHGLTSQRVEEIAKAYFHQDGTELGDMKTAIRVAVREALAQSAPAATAPSASAQQAQPVANNEAYDLAYDKIDRFLRSNLDDDDYAEFSRALDSLFAAPAPASPAALTREAAQRALVNMGLDRADLSGDVWDRIVSAVHGCVINAWKGGQVLERALAASPAALTDAKTLALGAMVDAMRWWGAQEDGIPAECKKAFDSAMLALGWSYSHPQDLKVLAASPAAQGDDARDAARYRGIRSHFLGHREFPSARVGAPMEGNANYTVWRRAETGAEFDHSIDAAMSATPPAAES